MKELKQCLVCGGNLNVFFNLGDQPLVNNLKNAPEDKDLVFPLVVNECPVCTHKQLSVAVDPKLLFLEYLYKTNVSESHRRFFNDFVKELEGKKVLDIGCNDGSLLWVFQMYEWETLGIEPCYTLVVEAQRKGIGVICDFFPTILTSGLKFDVITAFNVFAHNDDPKTFLIEMAKLLKENGRIYILTTPARLDNYYHEHISYFTPQSMMVLAQRCGVEVVSFKEVSMHSKSYLFEIKKPEIKHSDKGFHVATPYVAYGASASEIVLFNYFKVKPEYVVDDNPLKQGKFVPGINCPIVPIEHLVKDHRDLTIIIAHNLFNEIKEKIEKVRPYSKHKDRYERLV